MNKNSKLDNSLKLIAKSSLVVFVGVLISKIAFYTYRVIVARHYGPEPYGLFSLSLMILTLFVVFFSFGLSDGLVRFISFYRGKKQNNKIKFLFNLSRRTLLISSIFSAVLLFLLSRTISEQVFHDSNLTIFLQISSIVIPLWIFSKTYLAVIRAFEEISWYSFIVNILQSIIVLTALVFLILLGFKSDMIMLSYFFGTLATFLVSYLLCRKKFSNLFKEPKLKNKAKSKTFRKLISYSLPLMFLSVIATIYYWVDSFVLGFFKGTYDVGIYNAAVPIVVLFSAVPDLFIQLFFPLVTKEFSRKNFELVKEISKQVAKWIFFLVLPLFLIVFIFPGAVINILFGSKYLAAEMPLRILALGGFISIFAGYLITILSIAGKSKTVLFNVIFTSALNLLLNIILVPRYGLNGAALATSIVWVFFALILFIEVRRAVGFIPLRKKMLKILLVSLLPTGLLLLARHFLTINILTLIILGAFFILAYIAAIFAARCFDKNDLMILAGLKRKIWKDS